MDKIGERIKETRTKRGLSQEELAKRTGFKDKSSISKIEKGTRRPQVEDLKKIAEVLGVHIDYLVDGIVIEREEYQNIANESHLFDYAAKLYGEDTSHAIHLFSQLKEFDRGKIIGMMEQMLNTYK